MPTVKLWFPGGRYHATPWGHHVNEGIVEWPPSPWRLLRAFVACGFTTQQWDDFPPVALRLFEKLSSVLPRYKLPAATAAHSRHFMPFIEGKTQKTTLVFDTWANVGDGELFVHWPCSLDDDEATLLSQLTSSLGYLGRSESWVVGELFKCEGAEWNCMPCEEHERRGPGWEQISVIAPIPWGEYENWRAPLVRESQRPFQSQKLTAAVKKKLALAAAPFPPDAISCLTKDTAWWKGRGWSQPPGSQRVLYWRPNAALDVGIAPQMRRTPAPPVSTMLLAITSSSGNCSALPSVARTLPQAELFHRAIVGRVGRGRHVDCPELTGVDQQGKPLQGRHDHAHMLPLDLDGDGHLDHILVHASMGLRDEAQHAIRSLKRTWMKGSANELQVAVVASGGLDLLRRLPRPFATRMEQILGPVHGTTKWESVTPFVPPRFLKRNGKNTLEGQIGAELESRGLPTPLSITVLEDLTRSLRHYVRRRNHGGAPPPVDMGYGIRLELSQPIHGPISLGYGSHFGLGLFGVSE